ncbi:MAG: hypothetical protein ACR2OE_02435 [Thermomicrobiales bacterium]
MNAINNPNNSVPADFDEPLHAYTDARQAVLAREYRFAELARPTMEERAVRRDLLIESHPEYRVSSDTPERLSSLRDQKFEHFASGVRATLSDHIDTAIKYPSLILDPPAPIDLTFWWARTDWSLPEHMWANSASDGLHFTGGPTHHDGDLFNTSFGATALFGLAKERIPPSATGRWISTPHVELFGGLLGYTGDDDIFTGDLWSKCWMHRRQTILQFQFGMGGSVPVVVGNAEEHQVLIFEENAERSIHVNLPGFQLMPAVVIGNFNSAYDLWAQVEVRFDIQLEGAGTLLWADPEVLFRTFQWPLQPL